MSPRKSASSFRGATPLKSPQSKQSGAASTTVQRKSTDFSLGIRVQGFSYLLAKGLLMPGLAQCTWFGNLP